MDYACITDKWIQQGAQIVGGCCGIFPEHIQRMKAPLACLDLNLCCPILIDLINMLIITPAGDPKPEASTLR